MGVVDLDIVIETGGKILGRTEVASLQKPAGQDAKPQLHLVEPGAMFGCKVEDMLMAWIAQECPALHPMAQVLGHTGHLAPLSHHTADVQAPVRVEIIHHPVVTCMSGSCLTTWAKWAAKSALVRVCPTFHTT